ncbi:MAG TPA: sigma-70 family RNA polymerase sigma factor [Deltaproteobacteria bacterium]|nr:sigma-70 family RNA polymerase sigma factor [Deltaproteobacteria bacterium]
MSELFRRFLVLRSSPDDPVSQELFYASLRLRLERWARRSHDPDEVIQRTLERVFRHLAGCRADSPSSLAAWLRTISRNCAWDLGRTKHRDLLDEEHVWSDGPGPGVLAADRALGEVLQQAVAHAHEVDLSTLSSAHRSRARRQRVAATSGGRARDVKIAIQLRHEEIPAQELSERYGMTPAAIRQAARRGAAVLGLWAHLAVERGGDLLRRDALERVVDLSRRKQTGGLTTRSR